MSNHWPNKPVPDFTLTELVDAIEQHQSNADPVTQDIVRSCTREWERRHGLDNPDEK